MIASSQDLSCFLYSIKVWDPHLIKDSDQIEKVQRTAARWVTSDYGWSSSVTVMLNNLNWPTLSLHRKISKLQIFYKAIHNLTALPLIIIDDLFVIVYLGCASGQISYRCLSSN